MVFVDTTVPGAIDEVNTFFRKKGNSSARVYSSAAYIKVDAGYSGAEVMIFEDKYFYNLFHIAMDKEEQIIRDDVWISKAYADSYDIKAGDIESVKPLVFGTFFREKKIQAGDSRRRSGNPNS